MLANEQIIVSFGSSLTLPMCIASIWNINGKLQTHRGQVIATKHHLDKIGAVPTNLTYGGNVVDYIIPHEFFYMVGSTIKLASTIPIKEDNYDATNVKYGILLHFCSWSKYICNPKHALWQLEPPPHIDCCHMSMVNTFNGRVQANFHLSPHGQAPMFPYMVGWKHSIHSHAPPTTMR